MGLPRGIHTSNNTEEKRVLIEFKTSGSSVTAILFANSKK